MIPQLNFRVINQSLTRTDTFIPVAGSKNYLLASFEFTTDDWDTIDTKTAVFVNEQNIKHEVAIADGMCFVPFEVLTTNGYIYVSVYGGDRITTNSVPVFIEASGYTEEDETQDG